MNYQSTIFSQYLGDEQLVGIVSDESLIKYTLQFEAALAATQAKLGLILQPIAEEIIQAIHHVVITPAQLSEGTLQNGIPVITLLSLIKQNLSAEAKPFLHHGATSQDAMDTAQVLILKEAIVIIEQRINTLIQHLTQLLTKYGDVPCMAHTRGQQAIPITFGVKITAWLQPLQRQLQRLGEMKFRLLQVQLGGAAGTLSVYKNQGSDLINELATALQLQPTQPWHSQRDNFCEFTNWLAMLTGITGKMGADILLLSQSEINEILENATGGGKSSAMPHKNNPVLSEAVVALAKINAGLQSQQLLSMVHTAERDATAWILEWNAIPQMIINAGAALNHAITISSNMKINEENMQQNIDRFLTPKKIYKASSSK